MTFPSLKQPIYRFLKWSEKYFEIDTIYIAKNSVWITIQYGLDAIVGIVLTSIFALFLTKPMYGQYQYVISVFGLMGIAALPGMKSAITIAVARGLEGTYQRALFYMLQWSSLGVGVLLIIGGYYISKNDTPLASLLITLALIFPLYHYVHWYSSFLEGKKEFRRLVFYHVLSILVTTPLTIIAIYWLRNIYWIIMIPMIAQTTLNIMFHKKILARISNHGIDETAIVHGMKISAVNMLSIASEHLDKILISIFLDYTSLAVYAIAIIIPKKLIAVLKKIANIFLPKLAQWNSTKKVENFIFKKFLLALILTSALGVLYIITAPTIFHILFPHYTEAVIYSRIAGIAIITVPASLLSLYFHAQLKTNLVIKSSILYNGIYLVLLVLLLWRFGLIGAVLAFSFARFINLFYTTYLFKAAK